MTSTMKAVVIEKVGASPEIRSDLPIPTPNDTQILVKSIYTAVNPVDVFMSNTGLLVQSWPLVPGCDAGGVVVKAGANAISPLGKPFKEGDEVFGCTRLGTSGYSPWGEYFLMDAAVTIPKPSTLTLAQASTAGVGILTAALGVFGTLKIPLSDAKSPSPAHKEQWALVLGGGSAVGKFAIQLFKSCGFNVVATSSAKDFDLLKSLGADETVDYKSPEETVISGIKSVTSSNLLYVYDAVGSNNALVASLFEKIPSAGSDSPRRYTTTNDFEPLPDGSKTNFVAKPVELGPIGREEATELNESFSSFIPVLFKLIEDEKVKPGKYTIEGDGIDGIIGAWDVQKSGKAGSTKVIVKVADA